MISNYQEYLASREWGLKKRAVAERAGGRCERCRFGAHEETHHLTYERLGNEDLADLLGVCRPCHEFLSGRSDSDPAAILETSRRAVREFGPDLVENYREYGRRLLMDAGEISLFNAVIQADIESLPEHALSLANIKLSVNKSFYNWLQEHKKRA